MLTLGIDLAAQPENTAACVIHWQDGSAEVSQVVCDLDDGTIIEFLQGMDRAGIDVPLGWPVDFVHAISEHHGLKRWPTKDRLKLRYRETDLFIHDTTGLWPLSVSTDRIGVTAMRAAALPFSEAESEDRSGNGKIVEVYPAAALCRWGFDSRGYKGIKGRESRLKLVESFLQQTMSWLRVSAAQRSACEERDDVFDALIASLVARARAIELTEPIPPRIREVARIEGWIALPKADSLRELAVRDTPKAPSTHTGQSQPR
jgi:predicted nuclease with RNAse H fold